MKKLVMTFTLLASFLTTPSKAETINILDVTERTVNAFLNCADYKVVGVCYWLRCGWGCSVKTSLKVSHFIPELTVQTYRNAKKPPFEETRLIMELSLSDSDGLLVSTILGAMGSDLDEVGGGAGTETNKGQHNNMTFTLTDSFGNPAMALTSLFSQLGVSCRTKLRPMYPYYISNLDSVAWRFGIPEMLYYQSLSPVGWELGSMSYNWGPYYPRIGHVNNHDLLKESGLIAFRSVHFISRRNQPHVYKSIYQSSKKGFWPTTAGVEENRNGKWQMISPRKETSCRYLPMSQSLSPNDGRSSYRSKDGSHVWNFWRKYSCCRVRGIWIGETTF